MLDNLKIDDVLFSDNGKQYLVTKVEKVDTDKVLLGLIYTRDDETKNFEELFFIDSGLQAKASPWGYQSTQHVPSFCCDFGVRNQKEKKKIKKILKNKNKVRDMSKYDPLYNHTLSCEDFYMLFVDKSRELAQSLIGSKDALKDTVSFTKVKTPKGDQDVCIFDVEAAYKNYLNRFSL